MNYQKLRTELEDVLAGKHDYLFADVLAKLHCMSTARNYAVLNAIVSCMDEGELYCECGTYQGGSLISALLGNTAKAIGVDNFSEFQGTNNFGQTRDNLEKFGIGNRVTLMDMDCKGFFQNITTVDDKPLSIQVYYYDGQHDYEGQLAGMEAGMPFLRSGSIIIVDDFLYPEVNRAVNQFIANHIDKVKILLMVDSMNGCDPIYWNGIVAIRVL